MFISIPGITNTVYDLFDVHQGDNPPLIRTKNFFSLAEIVIKVEKDHYVAARSIFTLWATLSEFGGLQYILTIIFAFISGMFSYNMPENMVAAKLYQKKFKDSEPTPLPTENALTTYFADCWMCKLCCRD